MAAILKFSKCTKIATCYLFYIHYGVPNEVESKEKKLLSANTGLQENWHLAEIFINFWCEIIIYVIFDVVIELQSQKGSQKWIPDAQISRKSGITWHYRPNGSKVNFTGSPAAILAAILNFSKCSRIAACYLPDIHYAGPKEVESKEKKTLSANARLHGNCHLAEIIINFLVRNDNICYIWRCYWYPIAKRIPEMDFWCPN